MCWSGLLASLLLCVRGGQSEFRVSTCAWRALADSCCPLRHDAMSATYCGVRVETRGRHTIPWARRSGISPRWWDVFSKGGLCCISSSCCCIGGCHTHVQSRAASSWAAGVVKMSASLDYVSVSRRGFCGDSEVHEFGSRMLHTIDIRLHLCRLDYQVSSARW